MVDIVYTWLNSEISLSKKITNIEKDFSNGYLFGELLYKCNQLVNFNEFIDSDKRYAKIHNFEILEKNFKNIEIPFDPIKAISIIEEKHGVATRIIYQIKNAIERKGQISHTIKVNKSHHIDALYSPMKFKKEIPILDKFSSQNFRYIVHTSVKSQNEHDMEKHLMKFEEFKKKEDIKIRDSIEKVKISQIKSRDLLINKLRNQAKKFASFNQAYEQKGLDNWKENLIFKKERERNDLEFELNQANKLQQKLLKSIKFCEDDMDKKINNFEKVLKNNFLNERLDKNNSENLLNENNNFINIQNQNSIKTNKNLNSNITNIKSPRLNKLNYLISPEKSDNQNLIFFKRKKILTDKLILDIKNKLIFNPEQISERDRRRRKMLVDLCGAYMEIDNLRKEKLFIDKTKKSSNQEKALLYEMQKMNCNKKIVLENRRLRNEMYDERRDMELKFVDKNEEEFLNFHKENFQKTIERQYFQKRELDISQKQKERCNNNKICSRIINLIFDIADDAFLQQQLTDKEEIDTRVWNEWMNLFIKDQSVNDKEVFYPNNNGNIININNNVLFSQESESNNAGNNNVNLLSENNEIQNRGDIMSINNSNIMSSINMLSNYENKNVKKVYNGTSAGSISMNNRVSSGGYCESDFMSENSDRMFLQNNNIHNNNQMPTLKIDKILNEAEIFEYLNFIGQWNYKALIPSLIENQFIILSDLNNLNYPIMAAINNNPSGKSKENKDNKDTKDNKKQVKVPSSSTKLKEKNVSENVTINNYVSLELKDENNPDNLIIPNDIVKNKNFADIIEIITKIKYENNLLFLEEEAKTKNKISDNNAEENLDNYYTNNINNNNFTKKRLNIDINQNLLDHIPIKIALLGQEFSGKKTQAKLLSQNFPLKIYYFDEIINNCLEILSKGQKEVKHSKELETFMNSDSLKRIVNEIEFNDAKYSELRKLALKVQELLANGGFITDDLYVDIFLEFIKLDFPKKTDEEFLQMLQKKVRRKEEICEILEKHKEDKIKRPKAYMKLEQTVNEELLKMKLDSAKGFVLVNFPNNYTQAKLLEKKLSGFIPECEKVSNELEIIEKNFEVFLDKTNKKQIKNTLINSGLDYVFYLDTDYIECVRRCFGRRLHPQTFKIYHLEDNPPQKKFFLESKTEIKNGNNSNNVSENNSNLNINESTKVGSENRFSNTNNNERLITEHTDEYNNNYNEENEAFEDNYFNNKNRKFDNTVLVKKENLICENLICLENISLQEAQFAVKFLSFENNLNSIIEFYDNFGIEKEKEKLFQSFEGNSNVRVLNDLLINKINLLSDLNEKKNEEILNKFNFDINNNENSYSNSKLISEIPLNEKTIKNEVSHNLISNKGHSLLSASVENYVNFNDQINIPNADNLNKNNNQIDENSELELKQKEEDIELIKHLEKYNNMKSLIANPIADILFVIWKKTYENYSSGLKMIFKSLRNSRESISNYYNFLSQKFIDYLKRPSMKQKYVLDYQLKFNRFHDDFPDLVDDIGVKEEFHQNVEDLFEKIMEINQNRRLEATEEKNKIVNSNWIENEMEKFYINLEYLFQLEADKLLGSLQIIHDFYACLNKKILKATPIYSYDIIKEQPDNTILENTNEVYSFPRIEKLYKLGLRLQYIYDQTIKTLEANAEKEKEKEKEKDKKLAEANNKQIPQKNDPKKKDEKADKVAKIEVPINKIEVSPNQSMTSDLNKNNKNAEFEKDLIETLKNEKAKYRFRLTVLKNWGIQNLKCLRQLSSELYSKFDDWIILSTKAENEAIFQLSNILRDSIETERKIKYQLELDTFDVVINKDLLNFYEHQAKPQAAKEIIDFKRFNITQLKIFLEELRHLCVRENYIRKSTFIEIMLKKYISSKFDNDIYYSLPGLLKDLNTRNFFVFANRLDIEDSEYELIFNYSFINLKILATYLCLLNSYVISHSEELTLRKETEIINFIKTKNSKQDNYFFDEKILLNKEEFCKIPMWFDQSETSATLPMFEDFRRSEKLKEIIFEYNKNNEKKTRTHDETNEELSADIPRSLILKRGRVGKLITNLVKELRTTMYPYTAINLKESKANSIKDYLSIKDVYGLSHMIMLTNTEKASYLRLAKMPRGPTVTFKIEKYCLSSDIFEFLSSLQDNRRRIYKPLTKSFNHVPLVIMNGFNNKHIPEDQKESVNIAAMLIQSFFPPINLNEIQLKKCKRVVLFNLKLETPAGMQEDFDEEEYDDEEKKKIFGNSKPIIEFRHYDIDIEKFSVKKTISNILNCKKTDLSKFQSISDYILKQSGFTSGSDNDDPNLGIVEVIKDEEMKNAEDEETENKNEKKDGEKNKNKSNKKEEEDNRVKVKLVELGPRIDLSIKKIEEGFLKGNVVYHSVIKKTKKEIREIMEKIKLKNKLKKQRKMEQEKNVENKIQKEEEKLTEEEREELRIKRQKEEEFLKRKRKRELKQQKEEESQTTMSKLQMKQFQKLKKGKK